MPFKKPIALTSAPDSPDRLFGDLPRRKHPSLYDHQGQVLRNYVSTALNAPDVALQLPTGSGKTLVGLLLAEWRRRKFKERVVYLCPTRQLVYQVAQEASSKYGISVEAFVGRANDYRPEAKAAYLDGVRLAVTTYSSLFNTSPFFADPEIIVVDDAHTSENYIANQWTVRIDGRSAPDESLFQAVASVLKSVLTARDYSRLTADGHSDDDFTWVDKVPTHKVMEISAELHAAISENVGEREQRFAWRMISDHVSACQVYLSPGAVLIRPLIPPTWTHSPFAGATQRIFMSATLGAGGDLERLTGRSQITRLPIPEGWDRQGIGRRFFVFPEKSLGPEESVELRHSLIKAAGRSLVLTPSNEMAAAITADVRSAIGCRVYSAAELETSKEGFLRSESAVAVIANRYDGIDFPDDDCRLLLVEGLPRAANLQERFLMTRMGANLLFNDRVQTRVLQALGRCTRGLNDYSAVVVTGEDLPAYLTDRKRRVFFHPELQAELEFGIDQSSEVDAEALRGNFMAFLEHGEEWEEANGSILEARANATQEEFPAMGELASVVRHEISWQKALWADDYGEAHEAAREVLGGLNDEGLRGYRALWHYLAGSAGELASSAGHIDLESSARLHFQMAKDAAPGIPWLVGLARSGVSVPTPEESTRETVMLQVERLELHLQQLGTLHNRTFTAHERKIREGLATGRAFEQAQVMLGKHLGFEAGKRETDASPDPWWLIGDIAFVFEDHANASPGTAVIDATKARQAASHPDWLREFVPGAAEATICAVLVTPARKAKEGAIPHLGRVCHWDIGDFREWAEQALVCVRELRRTFTEPGDLSWRSDAEKALVANRVDAPGLAAWLTERVARDHLQSIA